MVNEMTKSNLIILIIASLIILIVLIIILFKNFNEKLSNILNKLNESENEALEKLKIKQDITLKLIKFIETKYKVESKVFEDVKKLKIDSLNSFKSEKILNKCHKEILQIREDNKETKNFKELLKSYDDNELHIIALRTYHNKYTLIYNNLIKKFPYNIVSKIKKYNLKTLIEGKEISNNFNNDLDV